MGELPVDVTLTVELPDFVLVKLTDIELADDVEVDDKLEVDVEFREAAPQSPA